MLGVFFCTLRNQHSNNHEKGFIYIVTLFHIGLYYSVKRFLLAYNCNDKKNKNVYHNTVKFKNLLIYIDR